MRKMITVVVALIMLTTNMTNGITQNKENEIKKDIEMNLAQTMNFQNENAVTEYEKYLTQISNINALSNVEANLDLNKFTNEDSKNIVENFYDFIYIGNEEYESLYEEADQDIITKITKDSSSEYYVLSQIDNENGTILIQINDNKYLIAQVDDNIVMFNESGKTITLVETVQSKTFTDIIQAEENTGFIIEDGNSIMPMEVPVSEIKWSSYRLVGRTTNKVLVDVLGAVSLATGIAGLKISHPALGVISVISGAVSMVEDATYATLYIERYQSTAEGCSSYIREKKEYYQYSNYTGFVKSTVSYFHSIRPDQAGGKCAEYYYGS